MKTGTACLYLPNHIHSSRLDPGCLSMRVFCCMFDSHLIADTSLDSATRELLYQVGSAYPSFTYLEGELYMQMERALNELHHEYGRPSHEIGRVAMIRSKLVEALIVFLRGIAADCLMPDRNAAAQSSAKSFWPVLQFVHVHYLEDLTLDYVAQQMGLSNSYVTRMFREHTGVGFLQYIHRLRVSSAAHMLSTTDLPISDITFAAGFESFRTFARVFKEMKGQTPTQYRSLHQKLLHQ